MIILFCSCVENKIAKDKAEIERNQERDKLERARLLADLEKRKREAELELKEREVRLEIERKEKEIAAKQAEQLNVLELKKKKMKADHEKAMQEDKEKQLEIQRTLDTEMNKLKVVEEELRLESEKNLKDAELEEIKRLAELRAEHEKNEKEQALLHAQELHQLKMEMDKKGQEHDHEMDRRRVEIEAKFSERTAATFIMNRPSGETAKLAITNELNPALAAMIFDKMAGTGLEAVQAPPGGAQEAIQGDNQKPEENEKPCGQNESA